MATYRYTCEVGHRGLVEGPVARCTCGAPVRLSAAYKAIAVDEREWARLATVCERVPGLADVFATILQAFHNYAAVEGISIDDLSPFTIVSPTGVIVLELVEAGAPLAEASASA